MKHIILVGAAIVIVVLAAFLLIGKSRDTGSSILGTDPSIIRYQIGDGITEYGFLSFTFKKNAEGRYAQGFIDQNGDGTFSDDEWLVQNQSVRVVKDFPNRVSFTLPDALKDANTVGMQVKVALTDHEVSAASEIQSIDTLEAVAPVTTSVIEHEFGIDVPGASPDLKRGIGLVAYAQTETDTGVNPGSLPDLSGGPLDCYAIATANNLINMASQHGRSSDIPTDDIPSLIESIKSAMDWDNGITNAKFKAGKAQIIQDLGWPVTTEEILRPSMEQLRDALASGDGVEISTTMLRSASKKEDTGHVFTGVGTAQSGGATSLSVHDPATPSGTDTLSLGMTAGDTPYILVNYPMWDGIVIIDAIYVQRWHEPTTSSTEKTSTSVEEPKTEVQTGSDAMKKTEETSQAPTPAPKVEATFAHVKPGEYSEIYVSVTGLTPGDVIETKLFQSDSLNGAPQVVEADQNGVAHFTFRITSYGDYNANVTGERYGYIGGATVKVE